MSSKPAALTATNPSAAKGRDHGDRGSQRRWPRRLVVTVGALVVLGVLGVVGLNLYVVASAKPRIRPVAAVGPGYDCVLVLGAGIVGTSPSPMLAQRLDAAAELYHQGSAPVVLVSGDNSTIEYSEVDVMLSYLVDKGVPPGDVYRDHAGFSTYETMARARQVFGVERAVVVTQRYHLYRALFDARGAGIDAVGVASAGRPEGQMGRDLREILARTKDPFLVWTHAKPTFLGPPIDLVPGQAPP